MRRVFLELRKLCANPVLMGLLLMFAIIDGGIVITLYGQVSHRESPDFCAAQLVTDAEGYTDAYKTFDIDEHAETAVEFLGDAPEGARDLMHRKYKMLAPRVRQLADTTEGSALTVNERLYRLRTYLYGTLLQTALLQAMAMAALTAAMGMDWERSTLAAGVVYTTQRGRGLLRDKLLAAVLCALGAYITLAFVSLAVFCWIYPVTHLMNAPVSAALNKIDYGVILGWQLFITWVPFTELTYLLASLGVGAAMVCIATLLTFSICALIPNSYVALGTALLVFILPMLIGMHGSGWLSLLSIYSPVSMCQLTRLWFTDAFYVALFPWFETATAAIWLIITGTAAALGLRCFKEVDLCV